MVFSEIPAGAEFYFGGHMKNSYNYNAGRWNDEFIMMKWRKTGLDGLSIQVTECPTVAYDHPRPASGSNKSIRCHGHRLFFLSSLFKYLNCADEEWKIVDAGDRQPRSSESNGFLSRFNENEILYLQPFNMKINVPNGYTKQYGTQMEKTILVGIPSAEQVGTNGMDGTFNMSCRQIYTWLSDSDTMIKTFRSNWINRSAGDYADYVAPIIRIKDDAPVDMDEHGNFIIRAPEVGFMGDLESFLGFTAA